MQQLLEDLHLISLKDHHHTFWTPQSHQHALRPTWCCSDILTFYRPGHLQPLLRICITRWHRLALRKSFMVYASSHSPCHSGNCTSFMDLLTFVITSFQIVCISSHFMPCSPDLPRLTNTLSTLWCAHLPSQAFSSWCLNLLDHRHNVAIGAVLDQSINQSLNQQLVPCGSWHYPHRWHTCTNSTSHILQTTPKDLSTCTHVFARQMQYASH